MKYFAKLRVFNTLTKKKELFIPLEGKKVKMFVCGVTVYDYVHLGHARTYCFYDLVYRYLKFLGYEIKYLQNVTDVGHLLESGEDRIIKKAKEERKRPLEIAKFYLKHWLNMMKLLKIRRPDLMPRATKHIKEIIKQVETILNNGYAYVSNGSVYFDVSKFKDYGKLSKNVPKELISGARVEVNPEKKDPRDFALWIKADPKHLMKWRSPWCKYGYPGWHIEDTAIAIKYFGPQYDIHGGAIELAFPHHEAEIAQAEATTGIKPYVKYWIHTGLLTIKGEKMSKSLGNIIKINDILKKYSPESLRIWIFSTHYRKPLDYNEKDLEIANQKIEKIKRTLERIRKVWRRSKNKEKYVSKYKLLEKKFFDAMNDDFNTPLALRYYFEILNLINKQIDEGEYNKKDLEYGKSLIKNLGSFFQIVPKLERIKLSKEVKDLIKEREILRKKGRFEEADKIREKLKEEFGILIEDSKEGTYIRKA